MQRSLLIIIAFIVVAPLPGRKAAAASQKRTGKKKQSVSIRNWTAMVSDLNIEKRKQIRPTQVPDLTGFLAMFPHIIAEKLRPFLESQIPISAGSQALSFGNQRWSTVHLSAGPRLSLPFIKRSGSSRSNVVKAELFAHGAYNYWLAHSPMSHSASGYGMILMVGIRGVMF